MGRRKKHTSLRAMRRHARERVFERYGVALCNQDLRAITNRIHRQEGILLDRRSRAVSVWLVAYHGCEFRVLYNKNKRFVVTFLPLKKDVSRAPDV